MVQKDMAAHDELEDDMEPLLHEEESVRRSHPYMSDSLDRDSRGWLSAQEREPRSGHTSPSPSAFGPTAPIVAYSEELYRRMLKRNQNAGGYREARGRCAALPKWPFSGTSRTAPTFGLCLLLILRRRTAWIVIDIDAKRSFMQADKRSITHQLGLKIPIRDLRLMDFNLIASDAGSILVRDNAIIFTIEHVRLIVTADKVLVPREGYEHNPLANRWVHNSVPTWHCALPSQIPLSLPAHTPVVLPPSPRQLALGTGVRALAPAEPNLLPFSPGLPLPAAPALLLQHMVLYCPSFPHPAPSCPPLSAQICGRA